MFSLALFSGVGILGIIQTRGLCRLIRCRCKLAGTAGQFSDLAGI